MELGMSFIGLFVGVGMVVIGAAYGISKLASAALEGAARQPEAAGSLQTMMIVAAAMIEGLGLLALVIAFLAGIALNKGVPVAGGAAPVEHSAPAAH